MRWGLLPAVVAPLLGHISHGYQVKTPPLDTDWTYNLGTNPWPEYPRPQLRRDDWLSLNGVWKWRAASGLDEASRPPVGEELVEDVLIPSCLESGISGVMKQDVTYAWFTTNFDLPDDWSTTSGRILLNFEAVDYEATVYLNGKEAGFHRGGYWRFTVDATDLLQAGSNSIHVFVFDPTDMNGYVIPTGKQTRNPSHIFYTPCTGIWQTVWLESVPASHITQLDVAAGMDGKVTAKVTSSANSSEAVSVKVIDTAGNVVATHEASSNEEFTFTVTQPKLWSPSSPTLYNLTFTMGNDIVQSYTGFRTISIGKVEGIPRPLINGEFIFQFGPLDQGWWPDGLMLPPNRDAMEFDLRFLKSQGINMLRKHIKVEPDLYYRACDELGILVIQDMVSLHVAIPNAEQQKEWERQIDIFISQHKSYPSIYTWVIYNEGWGQITSYYPEFNIEARIKEMDPTRLVIATSGWHDHGAGDWHDNHHYANPQCGTPFYSILSTPYDNKRIAIQGEFGGIGHNISEEHAWKVEKSINEVNQTYELSSDIDAYNYRGHTLMRELKEQVEKYACSAAVWTQTTDVEGEVNGFMTYDRRFVRLDDKWKDDIQALYDAAATRGGATTARKVE